ncbi:hypothetical protein CERSUDRAFT_112039 [Gelatoporia subvermispora B]|uniref:RING-type E3 ubiquitin transferase n=1 Tax=Ceriporiopsis subvermispora (strain B) TaxID=914234 RepID=M2QRN6_CERS8|nr:hypothetical protein CERSUDRAFT_112039 [Gelatoporia subvermispora B]
MIHIFVFVVFFSQVALAARSIHVDWIRKISSTVRDEGAWLWGWGWPTDGSVSIVDRTPPVSFPARPASFGKELADPLLGYVLPLSVFTAPCPQEPANSTSGAHVKWAADSTFGCPDLCIVGPHFPDPSEAWIALVQRGGCPFVEKARQAQKLGAKAVVVGGDRSNPDGLLNMYSERDAYDVTIAATYIKYWDYIELSSLIAASNTSHNGLHTLSLLLTTDYSPWEWYSPILTFVLILLLPSLLTSITLLIHRLRAARAAQRERAPEDVVHNFPCRVWTGSGWEKQETAYVPADATEIDLEAGTAPHPSTSHDRELPAWAEQQVDCAICLEMFVKGDRVRVLPCFHMFHADEIDEWLIHKKKLCPVCKADVTRPQAHGAEDHPSRPSSSERSQSGHAPRHSSIEGAQYNGASLAPSIDHGLSAHSESSPASIPLPLSDDECSPLLQGGPSSSPSRQYGTTS